MAASINQESRYACCDGYLCPSCVTVQGVAQVSRVGWAWLAAICLTCAVTVCTAISVLVSAPPHYAVVFAITGAGLSLGNALIAVDALVSENRLQIALCAVWGTLSGLFLLNCALDGTDLGELWQEMRWYAVGLGAGAALIQLVLSVPTFAAQSYVAYKVAGGTAQLQRQYHLFRSVLSLLKMDLLATFVVLALAMTLLQPDGLNGWEFAASIGALVFSFVLAWVGWLAIVRESLPLTAVFCLASLVQPGLMGWKLWLLRAHPELFAPGVTIASLGPACAVAFVIRAALIVFVLVASRGFGMGLKEVAFSRRRRVRSAGQLLSQAANRRRLVSDTDSVLSIDGAYDTGVAVRVTPFD